MKFVIAGLLAVAALSGCVAVPYGPGRGVYVAPPAPVYYHGYGHRHHYHRHHHHRHYR